MTTSNSACGFSIKRKQRKFIDDRFYSLKRALHKLENKLMLFYDARLIEIMLRILRLRSIDSVLEIGCGQGTDTILISQHARQIVALDMSLNALRVAKIVSRMKTNFRKISFILGDAEHLPLREGIFDVVFCKDLLHHVSYPVVTVSEMKRVTKEGGKVVAIEANACNPQMILIGLIYFSVDRGVFRNTKAGLVMTFRKAGLLHVSSNQAEFLPRHILFEYRSPLCRLFASKSGFILRVLNKIENELQKLPITERFANYFIIHGIKKR